MKFLIMILPLALLIGCKSGPVVDDTSGIPQVATVAKMPTTVEEAVASDYRSTENRPRDVYRHPLETLNFFGLKPEMSVVEISPGAGWYLEILAPYLSGKGQYTAALPPSNNDYMAKLNDKILSWVKAHPELEGKIKTSIFNPPSEMELVTPTGSADMVLTFRNVHNWMSKGNEQAAFNGFFKALKPGGILGVVEHRADPKAKADPLAKSGYVSEADIIRFAKKAGFKLDAKSEINANPKDSKDHPEGVWTLPPSYRLGDKDREKYAAVGESDRMTLRFVKPANSKKR